MSVNFNRNTKTISGLLAGKGKQELVYSDLIPSTDNTFDLGSTQKKWKTVYAYSGAFTEQLSVSGPFSSGNATIGGNAAVLGDTNLQATNATNLIVTGNSNFSSDVNISGTLTVPVLSVPSLDCPNAVLGNPIISRGDCITNNNSYVSGETTITGDAVIAGNLYCGGGIFTAAPSNTFIHKNDSTGDIGEAPASYKLYIQDGKLRLGYYKDGIYKSNVALLNVPS